MRRYAKLSTLDLSLFREILTYFFDKCDKINIYFPNKAEGHLSSELSTFKNKFLDATHLVNMDEDFADLEASLEEKEGFSMIIASLNDEVKALLLEMKPELHLNLGLISGDKVLFFMSDDEECVIEANEHSEIFKSSLFNNFKTI